MQQDVAARRAMVSTGTCGSVLMQREITGMESSTHLGFPMQTPRRVLGLADRRGRAPDIRAAEDRDCPHLQCVYTLKEGIHPPPRPCCRVPQRHPLPRPTVPDQQPQRVAAQVIEHAPRATATRAARAAVPRGVLDSPARSPARTGDQRCALEAAGTRAQGKRDPA